MKDGKAAWKLPAREAMRRTEELRGSNIFPPQVTIAAGRMVQEGMLPEDTTLPVNLEEGKNLFEGYLKNRDRMRKAVFHTDRRRADGSF